MYVWEGGEVVYPGWCGRGSTQLGYRYCQGPTHARTAVIGPRQALQTLQALRTPGSSGPPVILRSVILRSVILRSVILRLVILRLVILRLV